MTHGEEHVAFYYFIGLATTQWAHVENGLYNLALASMGREISKMLGPSFYSIANFRSKLAFANEAFANSKNFSAFETEWANLRACIRSLSTTRNKIAHGSVIGYYGAPVGRRYAIIPFNSTETKFRSKVNQPPSDALCVRDIDLAARQFARASSALLGLCARLEGHKDPFAEHTRQESRAQPLGQLVRQIRAVLQPCEGSSPQ